MCIPIPGWKVGKRRINPPDKTGGSAFHEFTLIKNWMGEMGEDRVI
jgi:hypothetical protein